MEEAIKRSGVGSPESEILRHAKEYGFSDKRIAELTGKSETEIRNIRKASGLKPVYKLVDTARRSLPLSRHIFIRPMRDPSIDRKS